MKLLLTALLAVLFCGAAQAQICALSQNDIVALASSPSKLTPNAFLTLAPSEQTRVCETRNFVRVVDAQNGVISDLPAYSIKYLSPAENRQIIDASNEYMKRLLNSAAH
ncbi:MAG TPA: hypothetical protein VJ476_11940 [Rhizomicrobium sp.]|nr:hypothetical protein [Rhizomicrobium sp.]